MDVERTALPGIGLRHEFRTAKGQLAAVVSHVSGRRDIILYRDDDPETVAATLSLTTDEANGVAELLGTARIVERLAALKKSWPARRSTGVRWATPKRVRAPVRRSWP
jgi:TrkA domain protein